MADAVIQIEIDTSVLVLDYAPAAQDQLAAIDPAARAAWDAAVAAVGAMSLDPLFSSVDKDALADLLDAGRLAGGDPPDLLAWFEVVIDEASADAVLGALQDLAFVRQAVRRPDTEVAAVVAWATNPETANGLQIEAGATGGVDAKFAWQIDGGTGQRIRLVDIEHGWDLTHEDLSGAAITKAPAPAESDVDHGTSVAGVLVAPDNGKGIVGIVPAAELVLVNELRPSGRASIADAIVVGAASLTAGQGDILLIELGELFGPTPGPNIPVEHDPPVLRAIQAATALGITVIEPAGNGSVNLDATPALFRLSPPSAGFVDSGAIIVGASGLDAAGAPLRASFSTFGQRVDCFGPGTAVRAPTTPPPNSYTDFGGTSGASAVIAGAAAAVQAMSFAHTGKFLTPRDLRDTFRDARLCTTIAPGKPGGIGGMPDLRQIAANFGWARILPPALATSVDDGLFLVGLDANGNEFRRRFVSGTGWEAAVTDTAFFFSGQTAALSVTPDAAGGSTSDAYLISADGTVHHQFWDASGTALGDVTVPRSASGALVQDRAVAAVRPDGSQVKLVGVRIDGSLAALSGDAASHLAAGFDPPVAIDGSGAYRGCAGPALVSRVAGTADAVAITDDGVINLLSFNQLALIGTGWTPPLPLPTPGPLDPRVRPALAGGPASLVVLAVGADGELVSAGLAPPAVAPMGPVDAGTPIGRQGPVALVLVGADLLVALAVGQDLLLRFSTRRLADPTWAPLSIVDPDVACSPLGGVVAVSVSLTGAAAICAGLDGRLFFATFSADSGWTALQAI